MKKPLFRLFVAAIAALCLHGAGAQTIKERVDRPVFPVGMPDNGVRVPARSLNHAPFKAVSSVAEGPVLRGWMSYCESWDKNNSNYGVYSFPAVAGTRFEKVFATRNASAAANADGRVAAYYVLNYGGAVSIRYFMFDADSGEQKAEATFGTSNTADIYTQYAYTLAYNHADATLYGEFFKMKNNDLAVCISSIDPLTGKATEVAEINSGSVLYVAMAFDNGGTLYAIGDDGNLYTVSLVDGNATLIGSTGIEPDQPQSAWFDASSNTIYWSSMTKNLTSALHAVDPATGAATLVSDYPSTTWMVGLYGDHTPTGKVPADITDLTVDWVANASLDGTIRFTAPAKAADGSSLNEDLEVSLFIDYEKVAAAPATITPGESYTFARSFTAGTHTVEVQLTGNNGCGDRARALIYAGTDRPGPVGNLDFTLSGRTASLSWTAPTTGANGGWFDPAGLSYKIVRRPDNRIVATAYTSTNFTDEIPDDLGYWYYEVTSVTTTEGATVESNRILYGTAKQVPYKETFDTNAPIDLFTMEDVNNDGYYWKWKDGVMVDGRGEADEAGDWMITPPIALTTDWIYKMTFDAHGYGTYYTETAVAAFGSSPQASAMNPIGSFAINGEKWISCEALVEIDRPGNYYLGIQHATPPPSSARDDLFIDNIELVPYISTAAPASADGLTIAQLPDNALRGTITFKAPVKAINGTPLTSLSKIEFYTDGTLTKTETEAAPGQEFSWEIELPKGSHNFNVIAYNEAGRGHDTNITAFGGVDVPGIVNNLRYEWDPSDDLKATLKWDAPSPFGTNGYPIDLSKLTYTVLAPMWGMMMPNKTGLTEMQCEVTVSDNTQALVQRGVQAVSEGGNGVATAIYVNLGKPVPTPVYESFSGGAVNYATWSISMLSGGASWGMSNSHPDIADAQDDDNGFAACMLANGAQNGEGRLISPAFDFSSTTPMFIHLWVFQSPAYNPETSLTLEYSVDGCEFRQLSQPIRLTGAPGWTEHTVSLAPLAGVRKALLGFRATLPDPSARVLMDNIVIDNDAAGIDAVAAGSDSTISIEGATGSVLVSGAAGLGFNAYTPDGRLALSTTLASGTESVTLPAGIYIVKVGKQVAKVTVR